MQRLATDLYKDNHWIKGLATEKMSDVITKTENDGEVK